MPERRSRISPAVLADLARRVHPEQPTNHLQAYSAYVLGGLWLGWVLIAPVLLILLPFGANFTAQWLVAGVYLLGASCITVGFGFLVAGILSRYPTQQMHYLLFGGGILLATACVGILGFFGTSDQVSPLLPLSASGLLAIGGSGFGVFLVRTQHQHLLLRLLWLIGLWSFSISIVISTVIVQADRLPIPPTTLTTLHTLQTVTQPLALCSYFLALFGNNRTRQKRG